MQVSVHLADLPIPEYLDFHSGYSAPRSRIAGIYSRIYSYSRIFPNERALSGIQRNFEIGFRYLVLLENISFNKIFEAVTQKLAIRCK